MKNAVLITGGAKRLGSLIAQQLSKEDYFIIIHYNESENEAIRTKEKILENGGDVALIKKNIKSALDASELILEALSFVKKNSVNQFTLINNASAFIYDSAENFEENILTITDGKRLEARLTFNVFIGENSEFQTQSIQGNISSYGEITGDFTLKEFDILVQNTQSDLIIRLSHYLESKI